MVTTATLIDWVLTSWTQEPRRWTAAGLTHRPLRAGSPEDLQALEQRHARCRNTLEADAARRWLPHGAPQRWQILAGLSVERLLMRVHIGHTYDAATGSSRGRWCPPTTALRGLHDALLAMLCMPAQRVVGFMEMEAGARHNWAELGDTMLPHLLDAAATVNRYTTIADRHRSVRAHTTTACLDAIARTTTDSDIAHMVSLLLQHNHEEQHDN